MHDCAHANVPVADKTDMVSFSYQAPHLAYIACPSTFWDMSRFTTKQRSSDAHETGLSGIYNFALTLKGKLLSKPNKRKIFDHNHFTPVSLSINGIAGRRVGVVLDRDRKKWICFDLDAEGDPDTVSGMVPWTETTSSDSGDDVEMMNSFAQEVTQ